MSHTPVGKLVAPTSLGEVELSFAYKLRNDHFVETAVEESCALGVRFSEPRSLEETLQACTALQHFVTIGVDAPVPITSVLLSHADFVHMRPQGKTTHDPIDLYTELQGSDVPKEARAINPMQMMFVFDDIGGLERLARWLEVANKFKPVIGLLMSRWYLPKLYADIRFFNVVTAAEALARVRLQRPRKGRIKLYKGLKELVSHAGDTFEALVGDADCWVKEVVRVRNNNVVHRGLDEEIEVSRLHWLSESVYFLVVLVLLKESRAPEATIAKMQNHRRFVSLAKILKNV